MYTLSMTDALFKSPLNGLNQELLLKRLDRRTSHLALICRQPFFEHIDWRLLRRDCLYPVSSGAHNIWIISLAATLAQLSKQTPMLVEVCARQHRLTRGIRDRQVVDV